MQKRYNSSPDETVELVEIPELHKIRGYHLPMRDTTIEKMEYHTCLEIGLCHEGSGVFYIRDEIYPFTKGDISIVYAHEKHNAFHSIGISTSWHFFMIDTDALFADWPDRSTLNRLLSLEKRQGHILTPPESQQVLPYLLQLRRIIAYDNRPIVQSLHAASLVCCLLHCIRNPERSPDAAASVAYSVSDKQQIVYAVLQYMLNHYAEPITTEDLCARFYISPAYLRRLFQNNFSVAPVTFLHKIRLLHACALLRSTTDSILSISERCGYTSLTSFNRQFRKIMHTTPSEYRKKYGTSE